MRSEDSLANLSERQLLTRFGDLVRKEQRHTAQLLAAIAEIDERKLWAKHACPSMFAFCVERFHMSESMTAKRIWAARTARRFPVILRMVARGELHLSAIVRIAKHLTEDNHRGLLLRARHKSAREQPVMVVFGQVLGELHDRAQMQLAASDHMQNHRKAPCSARRPDALGGHRFRHMKAFHTEREHRRTRMFGPQPAFVDLGQRSEQLRGVSSVLTDEVAEASEQLSFREVCK